MTTRVRIQLSAMMFLQFFIWGAWFVTMGTYLFRIGFQGTDIGDAYSTTGWAAIISPFFVGMVADRFFSAQKVHGALHIAGGAILYLASRTADPGAFFWILLLYALCYMPTLALSNAIAFHQMEDPGTEFPNIRVLGTIGWIAAGWIIGLMQIEDQATPMVIAAVVSVAAGLYSFSLPDTPPKASGSRASISQVLGLKALGMLRDRSFFVFAISSLSISIPLAFYYNFTNSFLNELGMENAAGKMTFGQMSEIVFMVAMPFFFSRLGVKKMLLIGMACWVARYVLFAAGDNGDLVFMLYAGILLHGVCYDFFFVTGQIYVDDRAPEDVRASAQGFIALVTYGVGMVVGGKISGWVVERYSSATDGGVAVHDWAQIWWIPAVMAGVVVALFAILFKDKQAQPA